jgi:hypothetical protein
MGEAAAAMQMGIETTVVMMPVREAHQAEPTWAVAEAMKAADVNIYLTSKAMVHSKAASEAFQGKKVRSIIMEQVDYAMLTSPVSKVDYFKIQEVEAFQEALRRRRDDGLTRRGRHHGERKEGRGVWEGLS